MVVAEVEEAVRAVVVATALLPCTAVVDTVRQVASRLAEGAYDTTFTVLHSLMTILGTAAGIVEDAVAATTRTEP